MSCYTLHCQGLHCVVVGLKPGHLDWVRDYVFHVKPVYPFPPFVPYYLYLRPVLYHSLWLYRLNHPLATVELVSAMQPQQDTHTRILYVQDLEVRGV